MKKILVLDSSTSNTAELAPSANSVLVTNATSDVSYSTTLPTTVQNNITSTGTITTGTWQGTAIGATYISGLGTMSTQDASNVIITGGSIVEVGIKCGNSLGLAIEGTGSDSTKYMYITSADNLDTLGGTGKVKFSVSMGTSPADRKITLNSNATFNSITSGQIVYASAANTFSSLSNVNNSVMAITGSGSPDWATTIPSAVQNNITSTGTITAGVWNGTAITESYGGTGKSSYVLGDILYASGTSALSTLAGNTSTIIRFLRQVGNGTVSAAPSWAILNISDIGSISDGTILGNSSGSSAAPSALTTLPSTVQNNITALGTISEELIVSAGASDGMSISHTGGNVGIVLQNTTADNTVFRLKNNSNNWWDFQSNTDNSFSLDYNDTVKFSVSTGGQITLTPSTAGQVISCNPNSDAVGNVFCYIGNTGGTGSAGHTCGYKTGSYNGGEIGLLSNGATSAVSGIAANSTGIYLTDKNFYITTNGGSGSSYSEAMEIINSNLNIGLWGGSYGSGTKVMFIGNRSAAPTSNPSAGGILYAESGAGKWRGSSGTVTTFGPAEPHCPICGSDFALQWQNDSYGGELTICMKCLVKDIGPKDYILMNGKPMKEEI